MNLLSFEKRKLGCPCAECVKRFASNGGLNPRLEARVFELLTELEKFYRHLGKEIRLDSVVLCAKENARRGGPKMSYHLTGEAALFSVNGESGESLRGRIETLIKLRVMRNGGLGTFERPGAKIHYDIRRTGAARWIA